MKGLELSRKFYNEYGAPMLKEQFPELTKYLAVGLLGSGSECLGFDDEISKDHDFEPGFCIFLPDETLVDSKAEFALERAYAKLPDEFMGYKRSRINPVGEHRHGVIRISDFLERRLGNFSGVLSNEAWLYTDEQYLLEITNGELFFDNLGVLSDLREQLSYMPEDIRLKKLAGNLLLMAQAGQYNYNRLIKRGETGAAQLSLFRFTEAALAVIFLINKKYKPYYKWAFRALTGLPLMSHLSENLELLISTPNDDSALKSELIEKIAAAVIAELEKQCLTTGGCLDLERHAYSVNDKIKDANLRNMNILSGV